MKDRCAKKGHIFQCAVHKTWFMRGGECAMCRQRQDLDQIAVSKLRRSDENERAARATQQLKEKQRQEREAEKAAKKDKKNDKEKQGKDA